jgi:hypothetical protein
MRAFRCAQPPNKIRGTGQQCAAVVNVFQIRCLKQSEAAFAEGVATASVTNTVKNVSKWQTPMHPL